MNFISTCRATVIVAVLLVSAAAGAQTAASGQKPAGTSTAGISTNSKEKDFSLELAKADLAKQGIKHPTQSQLDAAQKSIQSRRSQGEGWGEIAHSLGLNLGKVVSAANHQKHDGKRHEGGKRKEHEHEGAKASKHEGNGPDGASTHGEHSSHGSGPGAGSSHGK